MRPTTRFTAEASDGVQIALHRLRAEQSPFRTPVLLVPGTFSTRTFWLGTKEQGFGRTLAAAGFDTWIVELRGHGDSDRPRSWTLDDWIRKDAPAAVEAVLREAGAPDCFWIGHSAGGVVGAGLAGSSPASGRKLRGLVLLGSPGPAQMRGVRKWGARAIRLLTTLSPHLMVPGEPFALGPEHEPTPLIHHWMGWNLGGAWRGPTGEDYLEGLGEVRAPVLAVGGGGDRFLAPPHTVRDLAERFGSEDRTVVVAGTETGFQEDYGHADLLISRSARQEIWPLLLQWLRARAR